MIVDPLTYLTVEQLQRLLRDDTPPDEADQGLAHLGATLAEHQREERASTADCSRIERHLLSQYLELDAVDLDRIPTAAHGWFLERLPAAADILAERPSTLVRVYFQFNDGLLRHLTIGAVLSLDRWVRERERFSHSYSQMLWQAILSDESLSPTQQELQLREFAEILLDHFDVMETEVLQSLGELGEKLGFRELTQKEPRFRSLRSLLYRWAESFGDERGVRLRAIIQ